jgi:hypothetical protein
VTIPNPGCKTPVERLQIAGKAVVNTCNRSTSDMQPRSGILTNHERSG